MTLKQFYKFNTTGFIATFCIVILFSALTACAQDIEAKIKIISSAPAHPKVHIEGKVLSLKAFSAIRDLSFLQTYADVSDLGKRIENLNLFNESGGKVEIKKLAEGEFQVGESFVSFSYDINTKVPSPSTSAAHVSWLNGNLGLLMLNDLLPQLKSAEPVSAKIILDIPPDWKIASGETPVGKNTFKIENIENAIFLVGKNWREKSVRIDKTDLQLAIAGGDWQFSDNEAAEMANSILEENRKIFGEIPVQKAQILLLPFQQKTSNPDRWRAETRGSTVTIVSGAIPLKSQALQRLHEQLRHEIFHLWIPNALNLSGNYDWFYEGFTVYQALRTGVEVNQIRFQDYLNTLARAFDLSQNQTASLIEISNNRWAGAGNSVYPKGMIVAFLCDAALLRESGGKRSLTDVFRRIFQTYRTPGERLDANAAILKVLKNYPELRPIVQNYIEGTNQIEWRETLNAFGIETVQTASGNKLKVTDNPKGRQKDLLNKLGYNQWRKLAQKK